MTTNDKLKVNIDPARGIDPGEDSYAPLVDIYEDANGMTVMVAELPGAKSDSIDIRVDKGVLTISADGRREEFDDSYARTYTGFVCGQFFRAFALSDEVDRDKIDATFNDGLLILKLPRAATAKTRKIEIKQG